MHYQDHQLRQCSGDAIFLKVSHVLRFLASIDPPNHGWNGELLGKKFGVALSCKRRRRVVQRYSKSLTFTTGSLFTTEKVKRTDSY